MEATIEEQLRTSLTASKTLQMVADLIQEQTGLLLFVLAKPELRVNVLYPDLGRTVLPEFCRALQATPAGRQRCASCRCMVLLRAKPDLITEYSCYGGVASLAVPVREKHPAPTEWVVKTSGFLHREQNPHWKGVRRTLAKLNVNLTDAQAGYASLPRLAEETVHLAGQLLRIAGSIVAEQAQRVPCARTTRFQQQAKPQEEMLEEAIKEICRIYQERCHCASGESAGCTAVNLVVGLVRRNPGAAYSLGAIARGLHLTPNHLSTLFHHCYGRPFSAFLQEERLTAAMRHLEDPLLTVSEAAYAAGFRDVSYFCRCFKRKTGLTPKQWRSHGMAAAK